MGSGSTRALRRGMGSRSNRRAHTKHHTQTLVRVKGAARLGARKTRPSVAARLKELIAK